MEGYDDADTTADDVTVLRANSGGGSGKEAPTPRVLKQRFVLEDKLGSGGMGTVYRARDLRKVEARDRHPYVAVKVLNADFRHHPDAFIALQREASKSQAIAHPNIVSIFDFDKDGDIPYMVMELLEGRELTRLLRDYPTGIPDDIAWPVVEGLCAGLIRAHEAGITHADFKPGNVYVSGSHDPKIFDFGIARAVRLNQAVGDDTVFDPAKLAALTPAYASAEMLSGESPTPADDIYSFAIVVYLIFSGRHPYDRVRADEARKQGLVPERIKRLTRRQWRMLERCLAFDRADRPSSMREVAKGLIESPRLGAAGIAVLAAAAVVAVASLWFVATRSERETVARDAVLDAQTDRVEALLAAPVFDPDWNLKLADGMRQLKTSPDSRPAAERLEREIREAYLARIDATDDLAKRARLLAGAEAALGKPFDEGRVHVQQGIDTALDALLAEPVHDRAWLARTEALLEHAATAYPGSETSRLQKLAVDAYLATADTILAANKSAKGKPTPVQPWLDVVAKRLPSIDSPDPAAEKLHALQAAVAQREALDRRLREQRALERDLAKLDRTGCERLDPEALARSAKGFAATHPAQAALIHSRAVAAVSRCIVATGEVDQDQAMSLKTAALAAFGEEPALSGIVLDPCGMRYLIGNGTAPGRSGFCVDTLDSGALAPKLVVIANGDGARFAITKFEISDRELAPFCETTGLCEARADDLPARRIGVDVAIAYAQWLSRETHRVYRLPTVEEWRAAADGEADPNRNCQVQLAGVDRGRAVWPATSGQPNSLGVVNALGNVQEWVTAGDGLIAAGGAYSDPLASCVAEFARAHDGSKDAVTGIRLVREIS